MTLPGEQGGTRAVDTSAPRGRTRWEWIAVTLALVLPAIWIASRPDREERLESAVAAVLTSGAERPLDARLTGETVWRPLVSPRRGPAPAGDLRFDALRGLAEVQQALATARTPATLS